MVECGSESLLSVDFVLWVIMADPGAKGTLFGCRFPPRTLSSTRFRYCWKWYSCITKTCLYSFDPLKPHFYTVKLGFTGVYINFLISAQKHRLWVLVRTASAQSMFWAEIWKNIRIFSSENFSFLVVKFSIYLNRRVFVMWHGVR